MNDSCERGKSGDDPEEEFPLGDAVAGSEANVVCPYCGEDVEISLDPGSGPVQRYIEDCEVCCQPWTVDVRYASDGTASVSVSPLDE